MGNITIQGDLTGDVPGGEVGGASNLTTVGAIPYVSAAGILNQDPTALFWDAANNRLGVGTATPSKELHIVSSAGVEGRFQSNSGFDGYITLYNGSTEYLRLVAAPGSNIVRIGAQVASTKMNLQAGSGGDLILGTTAADRVTVFGSTGNTAIGTTTDSNFKLDVAASGSAGTARFYGGSGVSNSTKVVVQEGGGQSGNMLEWQNSSGANLGGFSTANYLHVAAGINIRAQIRNDNGSFVTLSTGLYQWSASGTNIVSAAPDLSLSRASAGVLQVGDGGSNANGYLSAARIGVGTASPGSVLDIRAAGSGTVGPTLSLINSAASFVGNAADINMAGNPGGGPLAPTGRIRLTEGANAAGTFSFWTYDGSGGASGFNEKMTIGPDGVVQIYNNRATTGVTRAVIRAGAGQSTTNLTEWQDSGGTGMLEISSTGGFQSGLRGSHFGIAGNFSQATASLFNNSLRLASAAVFGFTSGVDASAATSTDIAIARSSAGLLEINNGTAGTYRDLILRRSQHNGVTVADLPAAAAGNAGSIQYVTDANATTIGSTVAGGGANKVMVWSDGAAWKIFAS